MTQKVVLTLRVGILLIYDIRAGMSLFKGYPIMNSVLPQNMGPIWTVPERVLKNRRCEHVA